MEKPGKDGKKTSSRPGVEGKPEGNADVRQGIEQLLAYINQRTSSGYVSKIREFASSLESKSMSGSRTCVLRKNSMRLLSLVCTKTWHWHAFQWNDSV